MKTITMVALLMTMMTSLYAGEIRYPVIKVTKISDSTIIFEQCYTSTACRNIGKNKGYHIDDLNFSPKLRKTKAVAIGAGELVVGAFGGWMAGWAAWGAGAASATMMTTTYATGVVLATAPTFIDELNPVLQWKMANIEARISKSNLTNDDTIIIEFENDAQMNKFSMTLMKVLGSI